VKAKRSPGTATDTCSLYTSFDHFSRWLAWDSNTKNQEDKLFRSVQ